MAAVQSTRSKVYVTPKLWYLRISVLEAQDVVPGAVAGAGGDKGRHGEAFVVVKVQVGGVTLRTKPCCRPTSPSWNEELVFVVAEPFDEPAVLVVEARAAHPGKDEIVSRAVLPLTLFERRLDRRGAAAATHTQSQWFSLEPFVHRPRHSPEEPAFAGRVHLRACLDGAYHVMDEPAMYASDTRPTARQLWRPPIGVLEVGVLGAQGLPPMKTAADGGRGTTDAYCVAKYGHKWVRTRTVVDSSTPRWNEQYTWEVYDPCTVLTLAVFDNCNLGNGGGGGKDQRIGKVRIRLSTLEMDRVYTNAHRLVVLHPSGLRKNGDVCLAVRLTCLSLASVVRLYGEPLLPGAHYVHPFAVAQLDGLRRQAVGVVAARLGRAEPPLRREVVEYMLDAGSHLWSIRRSRANFLRATALLSGAAGAAQWLADVCHWRSPRRRSSRTSCSSPSPASGAHPADRVPLRVRGRRLELPAAPRRPPQADAGCRAPRRPAPTSSTRRRTRSRRRGPTAWCARGTTGCGRWPGGSRRWSATWRRRGSGCGRCWRGGTRGRRRCSRRPASPPPSWRTPRRPGWWRSSPGCTCSATRGSGAGCRRPPATSSRGCRPAPIPCYSI